MSIYGTYLMENSNNYDLGSIIQERTFNSMEMEFDLDLKKYGKYINRKIVYKGKFKDGQYLAKDIDKNYKLQKEVVNQIRKVIINEEKLIKQVVSTENSSNLKDVYFNKFEVVEIGDKPYTTDNFDLWGYTSNYNYSAKFKDGKVIKTEYLS